MDTQDLVKTDLNLLISMQILLEEQNVSRAAERMHITQPAMSKTLSRLRLVFDDPLFTRSSHGMQPTPRALELKTELEAILHDIQQLIATRNFRPETWQGTLTIALSEYIGIGVLPLLMGRLQFSSPGMTLRSITRAEHQLEQLAAGTLDFAIHIEHREYGDDYICHPVGGNAPVILARTGHPLTGQTLNWDMVERYPLLRLYIPDLEELEMFRHMSGSEGFSAAPAGNFETSHLLTALEVLRNTDYLMPGPPFVLHNPTVGYKIQSLPFASELSYSVNYVLVRHQRTENSPVHNWLWGELIDAIDELRSRVRGDEQPSIANT
jgi:DNA-binding transcriptional LysR family regulator